MKKSILTIVLAAMLVFAFTACEQPVPGLSKAIIDADIVQNGTFLVGQPFDASKFSVNVTYSDKSTGTLEGVNVVYAGDGTGTVDKVANGDKVKVTLYVGTPNYSGNNTNQTTPVEFTGTIVAYQIDSIEITAAPESYVYDASSSTLPAKDFTVVASYRDSNNTKQTVTMDPSEYDVNVALDDSSTTPQADEPADATATVTLKGKFGANLTATVAIEAVVEATPEPVYTYKWDESSLAFALAEESTTNAYIQRAQFKDSMVTVYKVLQAYDEDDQEVTDVYKFEAIPAADLGLKLADGDTLAGTTGSTVRFAEKASVAVEFSYAFVKEADEGSGKLTVLDQDDLAGVVETDSEGKQTLDDQTTSISIALRADYPKSFSATYVGEGVNAGVAPDTADFTYKTTWASGFTYTIDNEDPSDEYLSCISADTLPDDAEAGKSYPVKLTYTISDAAEGYINSVTTCTANVECVE